MAIAQNAASKVGVGSIKTKSDDGYSVIPIGSVWMVIAQGAPTTGSGSELKDAPTGTMYVDSTNGKFYVKTSAVAANTVWVDQSA